MYVLIYDITHEMMEELKTLADKVCRIARDAGCFLKEERKKFRLEAVRKKHTHDYVSYVDKESERRIVVALRELLPEAGFIAEEGSAVYRDEPYCWVVDPLDGTTNYIHDNAPYCVSIALRSKRELLLGVVYDPCRGECFCAWKGGGAYVNGVEMAVSSVQDLEEAFVVAELPYNSEQYARTGEHLIHELYGRVAGIRMNGSAALALCYVAAGRFDAWLEAFIGKWDFSAAALMVQEAGGKVTDFYGNDDFMEGHHIIATNGALHPLFVRLAQEVPPF
ncbi:inositol monophosphatase [Bacteroides helcogenes P 36-108]|uniref:Inositol-1-monophosphatase n=2 Tax=Bacteroides helcogenes TaxID=290053 RepID=E6SQI2_BACT6|nr:inositol monophosphatase [Bacteroides helcogenes P 36-108]